MVRYITGELRFLFSVLFLISGWGGLSVAYLVGNFFRCIGGWMFSCGLIFVGGGFVWFFSYPVVGCFILSIVGSALEIYIVFICGYLEVKDETSVYCFFWL